MDGFMFVVMSLFLLVALGLLIEYACGTYFRHKLNHFKQISSEMTKAYPTKQGERNGQE